MRALMTFSIRKAVPVVVLTVAVSLPGAFAHAAERFETEAFTVEVPEVLGEFAKQEQTIQDASGPIRQVTWVAKSDDGSACIVAYSEMSGKILDPDAMMKSGRDSLLKSLNATLENERRSDADGAPKLSLNYSAASPRPIFARTDFLVSGQRMYQVIFLGSTPEARQNADVARLFQSFRLK